MTQSCQKEKKHKMPKKIAILIEKLDIMGLFLALDIRDINKKAKITIYENVNSSQFPVKLSLDIDNIYTLYLVFEDFTKYFFPIQIGQINNHKIKKYHEDKDKWTNLKNYISSMIYKIIFDNTKDKPNNEEKYIQSFDDYKNSLSYDLPQLSTDILGVEGVLDNKSSIYNMFNNINIKEYLGNIGSKHIYKQDIVNLYDRIKSFLITNGVIFKNEPISKFTDKKVMSKTPKEINKYNKIICLDNSIIHKYNSKIIKQKDLIKRNFFSYKITTTSILYSNTCKQRNYFIQKNDCKKHIISSIYLHKTNQIDLSPPTKWDYYVYGRNNNGLITANEIDDAVRKIFPNVVFDSQNLNQPIKITKYFGYTKKALINGKHLDVKDNNENINNTYLNVGNILITDIPKMANEILGIDEDKISKILGTII